MAKRLFDILFSFSFIGIVILIPLGLVISLIISIDSRGGVYYIQKRVGKKGVDFNLFKFRTMKIGADQKGLLTVGDNDERITKIGYYLRRYKIDELPQLFNVLNGTMSIVGPRPEVRKYVELYTKVQMQILDIKPGITDYASLEYFNENELLAKSDNPEKTYINKVLPAKIMLNKKYIDRLSLGTDVVIIIKTMFRIFK